MTAEQFWQMPDDGRRLELVDGEVIEMTRPGNRHGELMIAIGAALRQAVAEAGGWVVGDVGFCLPPHSMTVRAPDVAYLDPTHAEHRGTVKHLTIPPTIAIEVNSPHDVASEVLDKTRWWLSVGAGQVWVVDPPTKTIMVHRPDGTAKMYGETDTIDTFDVLPGLTLPLGELFA